MPASADDHHTDEEAVSSNKSVYHKNNIYEHWLTLVPCICSSEAEQRMPGDFDGRANTLWAFYGNEAKSHDKSRIQPLKDDMNCLLVFVRSYFTHTCGFRH